MLGCDLGTFNFCMVAIFTLERRSSETLNVSFWDASCFGALLTISGFGQLSRQFRPQRLYKNEKKV
jgi:lipid-A-disaccharide synthase-like uncharacterized protein